MKDVSSARGRVGNGAVVAQGGVLAYPTAGHYDASKGTVELRVQPNWVADKVAAEKIFWLVDSDAGQDNRVALGCFVGSDGNNRVYFGNIGGKDGIAVDVGWRSGEWHHLTAYWDEARKCRALFIDGTCVGTLTPQRKMPSQQAVFYLGSGVKGTNGATGVLDEFKLSSTSENPEFLEIAAAKNARLAACERLKDQFSLERVAKEHTEVSFSDLQGMATPQTQRVPIQPLHHPEMVFVLPDLSISVGYRNGIGLALGGPGIGGMRFPKVSEITSRLRKGYQPIVESEWKAGEITVSQTAFGVLPKDQEVTTGKETHYVFVRLKVANTGQAAMTTPLHLLTGMMNGSYTCYGPYISPLSRWQSDSMGLVMQDSAITQNGRMVLSYKCSAPTPSVFHAQLDNDTVNGPDKLANCLSFDIKLEPKETRTIDIVMSGNPDYYPASERSAMERMTFDSALDRASAQLDRALEPAMRLTTPDRRLNDIYRAIILSNLGMLVKSPDAPWNMPIQSAMQGVWSWECAHANVPMMAIGYCKEIEPSLRFFTERQNGIGARSANAGPSGDVKSAKGSYSGSAVFWMNETGSVLWLLANEYRYSHDAKWLAANKNSILAAWDWIQSERQQTRILDDKGNKVGYYGLLPAGRPNDIDDKQYSFTLTDGPTWLGMSEMAKAFGEAGFPEAGKLIREAEEYRQCIVDVARREEVVDPETGLKFVPAATGAKPGSQPYWAETGPNQMFDAGLMSPNDDYFPTMVEYTRRKCGILMGLMGHIEQGVEWYPNQTERGYFKSYLARGEIEKALLVLYSNLAYGMANDTYQTAERFHVDDPNFSPFQPNASGNGRDIDMIRRMVIDEQDADSGKLWLLRGCPRRWFAKGQSIMVENATTLFGKMAIHTQSYGNKIVVELDCPDGKSPDEIRLVVRHPELKAMTKAVVNGHAQMVDGDAVVLRRPSGHMTVVCEY